MQTFAQEFGSLNEFYKYICETPINDAFRWKKLDSVNGSYGFTKTGSFEEATELFKNGWSEMAEKLTTKLKTAKSDMATEKVIRNVLSVAGYQPIVPLFLVGVPTNMMAKRQVAMRQKVLNVTKNIGYNAFVSTDAIVDESVKALQIVQRLEAMGYRVNLNICVGVEKADRRLIAKIRIKNANEKFAISKMAFPLVHPSMLRRLVFRYIEVNPNTTAPFTDGYGIPMSYQTLKKQFDKDLVLPAILGKVEIDKLASLDDIKARI